MGRGAQYLIIGLAALAVAGWLYRDRLPAPPASLAALRATVAPPPAEKPAPSAPDVLYTWVDKDGVTHYEQQGSGKARQVVFDGSRLTPVAPVDPKPAVRPHEADAATAGEGAGAPAGAGTAGSLHGLRQHLEAGAREMQAAKDARHPDL